MWVSVCMWCCHIISLGVYLECNLYSITISEYKAVVNRYCSLNVFFLFPSHIYNVHVYKSSTKSVHIYTCIMNKNGFPLCLVFTVEFSESLYFNQISNLVSQRLLLCTPEIVSGPEFTCPLWTPSTCLWDTARTFNCRNKKNWGFQSEHSNKFTRIEQHSVWRYKWTVL